MGMHTTRGGPNARLSIRARARRTASVSPPSVNKQPCFGSTPALVLGNDWQLRRNRRLHLAPGLASILD